MEPPGVVPVHPTERRELEIVNRFPRPHLRWAAHELGLVVVYEVVRSSVHEVVRFGVHDAVRLHTL